VSEIKEGNGWQRKDITIADSYQQITCKLWNELSTVQLHVNDTGKFTNVSVHHFNGRVSLNRTDEMKYKVCCKLLSNNNNNNNERFINCCRANIVLVSYITLTNLTKLEVLHQVVCNILLTTDR